MDAKEGVTMRIKIFLYVFALCIMLAACGETYDVEMIEYATFDSVPETVGTDTNSEDLVMTNAQNLEKYNAFIKKHIWPKDFIFYDQIKQLGEFEAFHFGPSDYAWSGLESYGYTLMDDEGVRVSLNLNVPNPEFRSYRDYPQLGQEHVDHADMRRAVCNCVYYKDRHKLCAYEYDGIFYVYEPHELGHKLSSVYWTYNGLTCHFSACDYEDYPLVADTFAAKLLNAETARAAVDELMPSCFPED